MADYRSCPAVLLVLISLFVLPAGSRATAAPPAPPAGPDPRLSVKETPLAELAEGADPVSLRVSGDGRHTYYERSVLKPAGLMKCAVIDGKETRPFQNLYVEASDDGCHFAVVGELPEGGRMLFRGGAAPEGPYVFVSAVLSRDGSRWAGVRNRDGKPVVVVDGKETGAADDAEGFVFSPDSKHLYYFRKNGGDTSCVVADGVAQVPYAEVSWIHPSADGRHVAYPACRGKEWFVVVDGKEGKPFEHVYSPRLSHDGVRVAYIAVVGDDQNTAVIDGKAGKVYARLNLFEPPDFSPDGQHYAYSALVEDGKSVMVRDGREGKTYYSVGRLTFSPNSLHLAYFGVRREGEGYKVKLVADEVESATDYVGGISITYGPDSVGLAFLGKREDGWTPVFDGAEAGVYTRVVPGIYFDGPAAFHCFAVKGKQVVRVDVSRK